MGVRPSVWFITACYQRVELTRICLEQRARLLAELGDMGLDAHCVVAADDANLDSARHLGLDTIRVANQPLARKVNDMIEYACREGGADYVVTIGSDDWCLASQFASLPDPRTVKTSGHAAVVDPSGERIVLVRCENGIGHIPWIIPRQLLEPLGFRPAEDEVERGIDGSIRRGLISRLPNGERPNARRQKRGLQPSPPFWSVGYDPLQLVDFKSELNITSYDQIGGHGPNVHEETDPFRLLATRYPQDLCDRMEALYLNRRRVAA